MNANHRLRFNKLSGLVMLLVTCLLPVHGHSATTSLVPAGSIWKYLDDGSDQSVAWREVGFDDGLWAEGPAELGYGDASEGRPEATVVSFGSDANNKHITTYFRHTFMVTDPTAYVSVTVRLLRDDGGIVYLNGTEVFRSNMPGGTVGFTTTAVSAISGVSETIFFEASTSPALLASGTNVVAVEIHQASATSSDISFDLELLASDTPSVTRGPYLQLGTQSNLMVRWRTDLPANSRVRYGSDPASLEMTADNPTVTTEHEVVVGGLQPDTKYYYSVGSVADSIVGGDTNHFFLTSPVPGSPKPTRVWVIGDSGTANANAAAVRDAYADFTGTRHTDLWVMLGDNAYPDGTDSQYQAAVFNMYPELLRTSVLWPTRGNHERTDVNGSVYYAIHTLPRNGEAGGIASGSEAYYSFDHGNIHFVCLDSEGSSRATNGPMANWLRGDIAANTNLWIVAYWHHPTYTKGSHNSDNAGDSGGRMRDMRENILPILEAGGVDLVLMGHSHSYERSMLIDGHYGVSSTLSTNMIVDAGDGREDGSGAYVKPGGGPVANQGAVYAVAGSSGQVSAWTGGSTAPENPNPHPVMVASLRQLGSMVLDFDDDRLDARFLRSDGVIADYFTILKGAVPGGLLLTSPEILPDGRFQFNVTGLTPGKSNIVEASIGLTNWVTIRTNVAVTSQMLFVDPASTNQSLRYYRVRELP